MTTVNNKCEVNIDMSGSGQHTSVKFLFKFSINSYIFYYYTRLFRLFNCVGQSGRERKGIYITVRP